MDRHPERQRPRATMNQQKNRTSLGATHSGAKSF